MIPSTITLPWHFSVYRLLQGIGFWYSNDLGSYAVYLPYAHHLKWLICISCNYMGIWAEVVHGSKNIVTISVNDVALYSYSYSLHGYCKQKWLLVPLATHYHYSSSSFKFSPEFVCYIISDHSLCSYSYSPLSIILSRWLQICLGFMHEL